MNTFSIISDILRASWSDFKKHTGLMFMLGAIHSLIIGQLLPALQINDDFYRPAMNLVDPSVLVIIKSLLMALIVTLITQHVLDIVYKRALRWAPVRESTFQAILVNFIFFYNGSSQKILEKSSDFKFDLNALKPLQDAVASPYFIPSLLFALLVLVPIGLAFAFRFMFISVFILEDKCSAFEAFNRSWNLSLGNFRIYLASLILPLILYCLTVAIILLKDVMDINIILILLYGFLISLTLLFNINLFKKLREIETTEE